MSEGDHGWKNLFSSNEKRVCGFPRGVFFDGVGCVCTQEGRPRHNSSGELMDEAEPSRNTKSGVGGHLSIYSFAHDTTGKDE